MEFVVVAERWRVDRTPPRDRERYYIAVCPSQQTCLGTIVQRGCWVLKLEETMAFVFSDFKAARRVAREAVIVKWVTRKGDASARGGFRVAILHATPRPGSRRFYDIGSELWPAPTDPVATLAALA